MKTSEQLSGSTRLFQTLLCQHLDFVLPTLVFKDFLTFSPALSRHIFEVNVSEKFEDFQTKTPGFSLHSL
jgi:hypothetical protein